MKLLVTGGAGFIGSNFIRLVLAEHPGVSVVNLDKLTYAGNLENLAEVEKDSDYRFARGDVADAAAVEQVFAAGFDAVAHFAAESHVDRSIENAEAFLRTNYTGTYVLLEAARQHKVKRFLHISTDEVYGELPKGIAASESFLLAPSSPYAASKAAADLLVLSYVRTYNFPAMILRCTNNYGPYQFPEKLIPLAIANALEDQPVPIYGDGKQVRDWLYVEDHCRAAWLALERGALGSVYNAGSGGAGERTNLEVVLAVLRLLGKPESLLRHVEDRPGHDRRYELDTRKAQTELGWKPRLSFAEGLERTVRWYREHAEWLARCRSGAYREYYDRHYARRSETLKELLPR